MNTNYTITKGPNGWQIWQNGSLMEVTKTKKDAIRIVKENEFAQQVYDIRATIHEYKNISIRLSPDGKAELWASNYGSINTKFVDLDNLDLAIGFALISYYHNDDKYSENCHLYSHVQEYNYRLK